MDALLISTLLTSRVRCYNYLEETLSELNEITSAPGGVRMAARA